MQEGHASYPQSQPSISLHPWTAGCPYLRCPSHVPRSRPGDQSGLRGKEELQLLLKALSQRWLSCGKPGHWPQGPCGSPAPGHRLPAGQGLSHCWNLGLGPCFLPSSQGRGSGFFDFFNFPGKFAGRGGGGSCSENMAPSSSQVATHSVPRPQHRPTTEFWWLCSCHQKGNSTRKPTVLSPPGSTAFQHSTGHPLSHGCPETPGPC